ncbi:SDR family NAD(P)-dependent oxidoreductase [Chryseobacterium sp. 3008163]|uniref:SDR family NAD(P)-dependent oxidoreductase n=1 Tax=Chryseobacterium sp. 3008163 TaxID=2478663 RepID=UPI000F0CF757|nr:SDR family oxidoreductase [Chryseobacterium sp. 3008163]AYM99264.1 SDR family oxidoreductase [Chryseobacterium sp. 3008163]
MKEYILITGASSGIGHEMAYQLAEKAYNLILVARTETKLQQMQKELTKKYGILVHYFVSDLSVVSSATDLYAKVINQNLQVSHLMNNAGVGNYGEFTETALDEELSMIQLNISSLVVLTKLFAQDMVKRRSGRIMNIGSVVSFLPMPYFSVYSATKAFVLAFSDTLAAELEGTGVTILSLYPGTVDTAFTTSEMQSTNLHKTKPMHPEIVAEIGIKHLLEGKGKKVTGFQNWFNTKLPNFIPDSIMMKIKKDLASQK